MTREEKLKSLKRQGLSDKRIAYLMRGFDAATPRIAKHKARKLLATVTRGKSDE